MTAEKSGWHWTATGWKRTPKRLTTVKKVAKPSKRKIRKLVYIGTAKVEDVPTFQQARKVAAAKVAAEAFTASVFKDVRRRRLGHYDDISPAKP
jgi:hypothetical protein